MSNQQLGIAIAIITALWLLYEYCVVDFVDKEQERTWRDDISDDYQERGCPFDEPLNHVEK